MIWVNSHHAGWGQSLRKSTVSHSKTWSWTALEVSQLWSLRLIPTKSPNKGWVSFKYLAVLWTHSKTNTRLFGGNSGVQECLPTGENWVNYGINYDFPGYDYWIYHHKSPKNSHQLPSSKRRFRVLFRQQLKGALQRNGFPVRTFGHSERWLNQKTWFNLETCWFKLQALHGSNLSTSANW